MTDRLRVGIVGVSGYGGGELARLLAGHPNVELTYVTSGTYAGKPLSAALPGVAKRIDLVCEKFDAQTAIDRCDVVFLAGEAGLAMEHAPALIEAGKPVIDLSADFRLKNPAHYAQWYKSEHKAQDWIERATYGLPELNKEAIKSSKLIANPGCYPTSAALALAPLLAADLIDRKSIIIDSHSGVSGAGRSKFGLDFHFSEVNESIKPYGVAGVHRHVPEIEQSLSQIAGEPILITFTPHLSPITRGILTTAYANLKADAGDLQALFNTYYADEPFVVILDAGQFPATKHTQGTNYCHIGLAVDTRTNRVIVISAIDNLVKGAAGQAIQNMNLACGFDETAGLTMAAMWP
ncbi:MAG: N-acetyl-gamma-glutamyl-phosphate reductase [Capsulimonas sp.]|uniref:N-acetyl-gamma-glutamyl-phosphate reductase n=1 Tax=Capsulimonas sp. TaxID=2494211 RepID=UPI0032644991